MKTVQTARVRVIEGCYLGVVVRAAFEQATKRAEKTFPAEGIAGAQL